MLIVTGTAGTAFLDMLGVFSEFETNLRRERQMEGVARAKALGKYEGCKPSVPVEEVRELRAQKNGGDGYCGSSGNIEDECPQGDQW